MADVGDSAVGRDGIKHRALLQVGAFDVIASIKSEHGKRTNTNAANAREVNIHMFDNSIAAHRQRVYNKHKMFHKVLRKLRNRRHFWRSLSLGELSRLYISSMLRVMALSLVGIFLPIFLYLNGYSITEVFIFFAIECFLRVLLDLAASQLIGRIGPKHTLFLSYVVQVIALLVLLAVPNHDTPMLIIVFPWAAAMSLFYTAYHVDFSSIRHVDHTARDISRLNILERVGAVLGPAVGGLVATFFGAQYTIIASIVLFMVACVPMLSGKEPIERKKRIDFSGLDYQKMRPHLLSFGSFNVESHLSTVFWPFYVAVFIFVANTYALVGVVASMSFAVAIFATWLIGKLIDSRKDTLLFTVSVCVNTILHGLRPFVTNFLGVLSLNIANDSVNPGYRMPYMKGWYDFLDTHAEERTAYTIAMMVIGDFALAVIWLLLAVLTMVIDMKTTMYFGFAMAALSSLLLLAQRFATLRR